MKKAVLLSFVFPLITFLSFAQNGAGNIGLAEQATSASCPICAGQNPSFHNLLEANSDKIVVIKYQRGGGGYIDPMWSFNPNQVDSRLSTFYGSNSFPQVWLNGQYMGTPNSVDQTDIDNAQAAAGGFAIEITHQLNQTENQLTISGSVTALQDFQTTDDQHLRVFVVVIEREVTYPSPPGNNNETYFPWVMRKMLPDYDGTVIGQQMTNDVTNINHTYDIDLNEIDPQELQVVCFVQNYNTKEVKQAASSANQSVGVEENASANLPLLYPTISDGNFIVQSGSAAVKGIAVYNAIGQKVHQVVMNEPLKAGEKRKISAGTLPNGIYIAEIIIENNRFSRKFIISR